MRNRYTLSYDANGGVGAPAATNGCVSGLPVKLSGILPTREGHSFAGWSTSSESASGADYSAGGSATFATDTTLYAVWASASYEVAFDANGGAGEMGPQTLAYGTEAQLPSCAFTRTGHSFKGWATSAASTDVAYADGARVRNLTTSGTVTLYAVWEPNTYSILFNAGTNEADGSMPPQTMAYGAEAALAANAFVRRGYTFMGWSTNSSEKTAYVYTNGQRVRNLAAEAGATVSLFAVWEVNSYTVAFDANGGTGAIAPQTVVYTEPLTLTTNLFTRTGHGFAGWATNAAASAAVYHDGATVTRLTDVNRATVTLYAVWKANDYKVGFDANGGAGKMSAQSAVYGQPLDLATNAFSRAGYTFAGWATESDGRLLYADGAAVTNLTATAGEVAKLYAVWRANGYTVAFSANAADADGTMEPQQMIYDEPAAIASGKYRRPGYSFESWRTPDGATYADKSVVSNLTDVADATVTLYAVWRADGYLIAYDANGGEAGDMPDQSAVYGKLTDLATNTYTRAGHAFLGWSTNAVAASAAYADGATVVDLTKGADGATVTLYAVWKPNTYTVSFDANGGAGTMAPLALTYGTATKLSSNAFARAGYTFTNWRTGGGATYADKATALNLTEVAGATVALYAQWTPLSYAVSFDSANGTACADASVGYGSAYGDALPSPTRAGYVFAGWYTEETDGRIVTAESRLTTAAATTLHARWTPIPYTLLLDGNGGEEWAGPTEIALRYGETATLPLDAYFRAGYEFGGWATNAAADVATYAGGESVSNLTTTADAVLTLHARWTPITYTVEFNAAGGDATDPMILEYDSTTNLPSCTRTGRTFTGWKCAETIYQAGDVVSNLTATAGATVSMVAQWSLGGDESDANLAAALDAVGSLSFATNKVGWMVRSDIEGSEGGSCLGATGSDLSSGLQLGTAVDGKGTIGFNWRFAIEAVPECSFQIDFKVVDADTVLWSTNYPAPKDYTPQWERVSIPLLGDSVTSLCWSVASVDSNPSDEEGFLLDHVTWTPDGASDAAKIATVPSAVAGLAFDGEAKKGVVEGEGYALVDNVATNAGGYLATATLADGYIWADGTTNDQRIAWRIAAKSYDMSGVTFEDLTVSFDGTEKAIEVSGGLPAGVTVSYEGNRQTHPGVYTATAKFSGAVGYAAIPDLTATLTIATTKVEKPTALEGLVYDGTAQTGVAEGEGYALVGHVATDAGSYLATATLADGYVWADDTADELALPWSIARAAYDMTGVTLTNATYTADGTAKNIHVSGVAEDGVAYVGNDKTTPGTYTVTVKLLGDANHEPAETNVTLTITSQTVERPTALTGLVYNGTAQTGVAEGEGYALVGHVATNAGDYLATATLADGYTWTDGTTDEWAIPWSIARAAYDMTGVTFSNMTFEADGSARSIEASGIPEGVSVTYLYNGKSASGTYEVIARFRYTGADGANYEPIPDMSATLTITEKSEPAPVDPTPVDPTPVDPTPVDPTPVDPTPVDPTPVDPTPVDPTPVDPTPVDPTPVDPTPVEPVPEEPTDGTLVLHPDGVDSIGAFTAEKAESYTGWLKDTSGRIVALLAVKTSKAKAGKAAKATLTVTPVGGKKYKLRTSLLPGGNPTDEFGIVYGARGLTGTFDGYAVEASADVYKSKVSDVKALAARIPVSVRTFSVETRAGAAVFSAAVAKTGKTKVQGFLPGGTKVSATVIGSLGEAYFAVPVVLSKKAATFGIVFWIPLQGGAPTASSFFDASWKAGSAGGSMALSAGEHVFDFDPPNFRDYLGEVDGYSVAPRGAVFTVAGNKWNAGKTVGRLKVVNGEPTITGSGEPTNLAALKFTYAAKTGLVKGSFKLHYLLDGKLKHDRVTITGAVVEGSFVGTGTVKKLGSFAVSAQ